MSKSIIYLAVYGDSLKNEYSVGRERDGLAENKPIMIESVEFIQTINIFCKQNTI